MDNNLIPLQKLSPLQRFCCTIGHLPSSYMLSLTYEEQVMWLCDYLKNTVIPAINNNAEATQECQELIIALQYQLEHLDLQDAVNERLDEMLENGDLEEIINQEIFGELNNKIDNLTENYNPTGFYKGKNLVVFGDSFTDPDNQNSLNGYWVNKVATVTGMTAFNFAKGAASLLRPANSFRMQVNRALSSMSSQEKLDTSVIIMYLADTDILEETNHDEYVTEYEELCSLLVTNFPNAKIIVAPFTWRCNKLYSSLYSKMVDYIWQMKKWTAYPCVILENCMYWLLGVHGYYQNEYHPNENGYRVIADHFINAIYGGDSGDVNDWYDVPLNLDDMTDDARCTVHHHNGYVTVEFHCVYSEDLTDKFDWIADFPKIAIPQPDIVAPLLTASGDFVGTFQITSGNGGRAQLNISNLEAGTPVFLAPLTYRAVANFDYHQVT